MKAQFVIQFHRMENQNIWLHNIYENLTKIILYYDRIKFTVLFKKDDRLIPFIIKSCIKNKSFPCSEGSQLRDFLYIDDFTNLIIKIIKRKKYIYGNFNVGFGRPTKVKNVIGLITKIIKKGTANFGRLKMRKDEIYKLYPSIKKLKKHLNGNQKLTLKNGIKKTINFYKK